jgi:hypothetical protein
VLHWQAQIDYDKLASFAGMTNPRSASNAWAVLKKKLMTPTDGSAPLPTPKKAGGRKKKVDSGEGGDATPKKPTTPRKRAKKDVEDGEKSPKKRGRPNKAKPQQEPEDDEEC